MIISFFNSSFGNNSVDKIAKKDVRIVQQHLKEPNSIIIYSCYVNQHYGDDDIEMCYITFGAKNGYGEITEDSVCVYDNKTEFQSEFDDASASNDYNKILSYQYLPFVKAQILLHPEDWINIEPDKLNS